MTNRHHRERDDSRLDFWALCGALLAWFAMVAILWLLFGGDAQAQTVQPQATPIEIRFAPDTILGAPGSVHSVGSAEVPVGWICGVDVERTNNESEHPDTDVLVEELRILDVEAVANAQGSVGSGTIVSDGLIEVWIRLGGDGVTSSGYVTTLDCGPPDEPTTTTTMSSPPTTAVPPTTTTTSRPSSTTSTTLSPPPVGPVPAGGGALADVVALDHPHPPPRPWYAVAPDVWIVLGLISLAASAIVLAMHRSRR